MPRPPCIHHCTSEPFRFFGRTAELALLDSALAGGQISLVGLVGPGGQGKTAIVQHWLESFVAGERRADGVFLWSFYRGKESDLCLRQLHAYAEGRTHPADVSASWCVDRLLEQLRRECWALVLDGTEVVQHDSGPWFGRFRHPELGRLLEELASEPLPGAVLLTTRFPLPELERRLHARILSLDGLDGASACELLQSLGVTGSAAELDEAAAAGGYHAKAVELLGTYLRHFAGGAAAQCHSLPALPPTADLSGEEQHVARVLAAFQVTLPAEQQDILALTAAFREPPVESQLLEYLHSTPVRTLLQQTWRRGYAPFGDRPVDWLRAQLQELVNLRLLERVRAGPDGQGTVLDAHPLVRRGFEHVLGAGGRHEAAQVRAGFLRGRPDRRRADTLERARAEVELFHAYCDAGLWNEADGVIVGLDNPKHRFLAPAFERDLLLRYFPRGDWRQPPLWPGFGRYRSLAICLELLGQFDDALAVYRDADAPLRGDALIARGKLAPLLEQPQALNPWQTLWQAYRAHALSLAGCTAEAIALARSLVPLDVYEWIHVFECLLRCGQLGALDMDSFLYRPPHEGAQRWNDLARQRMQADHRRVTAAPPPDDLGRVYVGLLEEYDRGGLPYERCLTRLGYVRWLLARGEARKAQLVNGVTLDLARRHGMRIVAADSWDLEAELAGFLRFDERAELAAGESHRLRRDVGYSSCSRP